MDGCGTNVETMVQVEGKQELTNGIIQRTKIQKKCDGEYDPNDFCIEIVEV